jgi:hypothetical protein
MQINTETNREMRNVTMKKPGFEDTGMILMFRNLGSRI